MWIERDELEMHKNLQKEYDWLTKASYYPTKFLNLPLFTTHLPRFPIIFPHFPFSITQLQQQWPFLSPFSQTQTQSFNQQWPPQPPPPPPPSSGLLPFLARPEALPRTPSEMSSPWELANTPWSHSLCFFCLYICLCFWGVLED